MTSVTFLASFPPIQSAIKRGQDGMRIQFDIPETEMANAVELLAMMNMVLRITVQTEKQLTSIGDGNGLETRGKRKSAWKAA
jgi:hypothetical protein